MNFRLEKNHPRSCHQKMTDLRSKPQFADSKANIPPAENCCLCLLLPLLLCTLVPWLSSPSTLPSYFPQMAIHLPPLTSGFPQPLWFLFLSSVPLLFLFLCSSCKVILSLMLKPSVYVVNSSLPLQPYTYCKEKLMNFRIRQAWSELSALLCTLCETLC